MGNRISAIVLFLLCSTALTATPPATRPLAVIWVGVEPPNSSVPPVDIGQVQRAYQSRGYRIVRADGVAPDTLRALVAADRSAHPRDFRTGAEVTLVIHGRATVPGETAPVHDEQLVNAFLDGIGYQAKGEILSSACFSGIPCRELDVTKTSLEGRVSRLIVAVPQLQPVAAVTPPPKAEERVLADLLEILVSRTMLGELERVRSQWRSSGPLGDLEQLARGGGVARTAAGHRPSADAQAPPVAQGSLVSLGAASGLVEAPAKAPPAAVPSASLVVETMTAAATPAPVPAPEAVAEAPEQAGAAEKPIAKAVPVATEKPTAVPRTAILSTLRPVEEK